MPKSDQEDGRQATGDKAVDARCPMPVASALLHHTPSRKGGAIAIRSLPRRSPGPERISGKAGPICPQLRKCHVRRKLRLVPTADVAMSVHRSAVSTTDQRSAQGTAAGGSSESVTNLIERRG